MTVPEFQRHKHGNKLVVVTAYDALFARLVEQAGIHAILVGDSLGVVVQGRSDTLSVTMRDMVYHTQMVARGRQQALVIADMPFMSYQPGAARAIHNAGRLLRAGAAAVKLEGGGEMVRRVRALVAAGIPVMGHLGMTPQFMHQFGGYKVQGKAPNHADALCADAVALERAGAFSLVLEAVPAAVAQSVTRAVSIPTIGIGAGPHCDGQVLVLHDLLGLFDEFVPKFVKPYAHLKTDTLQALRRFKKEVETRKFPTEKESYR